MTRVWEVVDVETRRDDSKVALIPPPVANRSLRDAEKIAADLNAKAAAALADCNLDPWTSRPHCIVTATEFAEEPRVFVTDTDDALKAALQEVLAQRVSPHGDHRPIVGYNVLFDLEHCAYHAIRLGLRWPDELVNVKPWDQFQIVDLYRRVAGEAVKHVLSRSLTSACRAFGLEFPEDAISGKDVQVALEAGRGEDVVAHCVADVRKTIALGRRIGALAPAHQTQSYADYRRQTEVVS